MKHLKTISRMPRRAQEDNGDDVDLSFLIASLQFGLDILTALQTKKLSQE